MLLKNAITLKKIGSHGQIVVPSEGFGLTGPGMVFHQLWEVEYSTKKGIQFLIRIRTLLGMTKLEFPEVSSR